MSPCFCIKKSYTFINALHLHHVEDGSGTPHVLMPHIYIMREDGTPYISNLTKLNSASSKH